MTERGPTSTLPATASSRLGLICGCAVALLLLLLAGDSARGAGPSPSCPRAGELKAVGKRAALAYAERGLEGFEVSGVHHPRSGDLGWSSLGIPGGGFKTCGRRVHRLTWYIDLHPSGMPCHACDSHLYVVRYRDGHFATLPFSG